MKRASKKESALRRFNCLAVVLSFLPVSLFLSGCGPAQDFVNTSYPVTTDRAVYTAKPIFPDCTASGCAYGFTVVASYHNRTDRPLYLTRCYPDSPTPIYGMGVVDSEGEEAAYNPAWACVGHDKAIPVQPGETRADTLHIWGPNSFEGETERPFGVLEGEFQLGYQVQICAEDDLTCSLVDAAGHSNLFEVGVER